MPTIYSLAYLTSAPLDPVAAIRLAHQCGYQAVGLRALPAVPGGDCSALLTDAHLVRETLRAAADTGVGIFDVEIVRIGADFSLAALEPFLALCGELGARAILVAGDDPEPARLTANYAALCDAASVYSLTCDLEFMPWTAVPTAKAALKIVDDAACPNAGILVDALHFARSATTLEDIAAIPAAYLHYAQLCDAPGWIPTTVEGLQHTARHARLLPGDGQIPLAALLDALQKPVPISLEIPNDARKAALGVPAWCQAAIVAARALR
jgi:sugar phosphate isomerase/epimerase